MTEKTRNHYEEVLPEGYREVLTIDAKNAKTGIILNAASLIPLALVLLIAYLAGKKAGLRITFSDLQSALPAWLIWLFAMIAYLICHELLHGAAYKILTGQKLTFGISWSCAFCGVPHIFVYRKSTAIAVILPFAVFTLLLTPLTVALFYVNGIAFWMSAILLGLHLGGCVGDLYVFYLLLFRYRSRNVLVRDTGPKQSIYVKDE